MIDTRLCHRYFRRCKFPFVGASLAVVLSFVMYSCGTPQGKLCIEGEYKGINQADFLILSTDGGIDHVDTLHLRNGEFEYLCDLSYDATFSIVYPNNTNLIIWAHSGDDISIDGDAQELWKVKVKGNKENELYTEFRQQCEENDLVSLRNTAARIIRQHPENAVSVHLLTQYFLMSDDVPADSINRLYDVLSQAQPESPKVAALAGIIRHSTALRKGAPMPSFDVVTADSTHHSLASYKGSPFILYFWAGWQGNAYVLHRELATIKEQSNDSVKVLGYSLDVDSLSLRINGPSSQTGIPTYCDYKGFNSPLVGKLGITSLPRIILVGGDGKIQRIESDVTKLKGYKF